MTVMGTSQMRVALNRPYFVVGEPIELTASNLVSSFPEEWFVIPGFRFDVDAWVRVYHCWSGFVEDVDRFKYSDYEYPRVLQAIRGAYEVETEQKLSATISEPVVSWGKEVRFSFAPKTKTSIPGRGWNLSSTTPYLLSIKLFHNPFRDRYGEVEDMTVNLFLPQVPAGANVPSDVDVVLPDNVIVVPDGSSQSGDVISTLPTSKWLTGGLIVAGIVLAATLLGRKKSGR